MHIITPDIARARVAKGAALLDATRPGWAATIDVGVLDLDSACFCVLGQIYGNYYAAAQKLFHDSCKHREHGFWAGPVPRESVPTYEQARADYRLLQDAWIDAIADRLVTGGAHDAQAAQVQAAGCVEAASPDGQTIETCRVGSR